MKQNHAKNGHSSVQLIRKPSRPCIDAVLATSSCTTLDYLSSSPEEDYAPIHRSPHVRVCSSDLAFARSKTHPLTSPRNAVGKEVDRSPTNKCSKKERTLSGGGEDRSPFSQLSRSSCSVCQRIREHERAPREFTYAELRTATKGFAQNMFLGEGDLGYVFKGFLKDGHAVAVKMGMTDNCKFHTERLILSSIQHANIITLVGFCTENNSSILVYDFICNGTLDWHLSERNPNVLSWAARRVIAVQTARGLRYLHNNPKGCIVHRDIRPSNILLTHAFSSVITGFGFAKPIQLGEEREKVAAVGKPGYIAPECGETGKLTEKEDLYAFGLLLLELISGRKVVNNPYSQCNLIEQTLQDFETVIKEVLDPRLKHDYNHYELYCMTNAVCMCVRKDPSTRPKIQQILSILEETHE